MLVAKNAVRFALFSSALVAASVLLTNCSPGDVKSTLTSGDPNSFTQIYQKSIVGSACVECHQNGGSAWVRGSHLDFTSKSTAYTSLISEMVTGNTSVGICAGVRIVKASEPAKSFLIGSLDTQYQGHGGFGGVSSCVPYPHTNDTNLSAAELTAIRTWISNGAKND